MDNFEVTDDFGGVSSRLTAPGTYHVQVTDVHVGKKVNHTTGDGFTIACEVLDGTDETQRNATFSLWFPYPNATQKDNGAFCRRKISRLLVATNQVDPNRKGQAVQVDFEAIAGHQIVVKMTIPDGREYVELAYDEIFHVDDPRVAKIRKHAESLAVVPPACRHQAPWFTPLMPRRAASTPPKPQTAINPEDIF